MQPTFLPGLSFFSLLIQSDNFVFLDNVNFQKQSWQQRNQIIINKKKSWLIIPVKKNGKKINEIKIADKKIYKRILMTIKQNYSKSKFFNDYWEEFEDIFIKNFKTESLSELNISLIKWACKKLKIKCNFYQSSTFETNLSRIDRLISINKILKSDIYLSPIGSIAYLSDSVHKFNQYKINLVFNNYDEIQSVNKSEKMNLSIIDLIFNFGAYSKKIILKGIGKPYTYEQIENLKYKK
jgi:hypothetical protein